jgi:branched-subunit amino acid transport protein
MTDIAVILSVAVATYLIRISFVALRTSRNMYPWLERSVMYVRPAAMAALTVTVLVGHTAIDPPHLAAIAVAGWIAHRWTGLVVPLGAGMAALAALTQLS